MARGPLVDSNATVGGQLVLGEAGQGGVMASGKQDVSRAGGKEKQVSAGVAQLLKVHRTENRDQVSYPGNI